jgi:hypothetical protein
MSKVIKQFRNIFLITVKNHFLNGKGYHNNIMFQKEVSFECCEYSKSRKCCESCFDNKAIKGKGQNGGSPNYTYPRICNSF